MKLRPRVSPAPASLSPSSLEAMHPVLCSRAGTEKIIQSDLMVSMPFRLRAARTPQRTYVLAAHLRTYQLLSATPVLL